MAEIKHTLLRLMRAPRRLCDPHNIDIRRLHHLYVLIKAVIRHILIVVGNAIQ